MTEPEQLQRRSRAWVALAATLILVLLARAGAYYRLGVRFDGSTLPGNLQFIDPELLKTRLAESLYYLRDQPPLMNLVVGVALKIAPDRFESVLHGLHIALGVAMAAALFMLLQALGLPAVAACLVTTAFLVHPATILYENWLMYDYPLAALMAVAAFFLHRFVAGGHRRAGHAFFAALALVALLRGTFHLAWLAAIAGGVALLPGVRWRVVARCAAVPLLVVGAVYVKNAVVFGDVVAGDVYRKINYAVMRLSHAPPDLLQRMIQSGEISSAIKIDFYRRPVTDYQSLLPPIRETGVPLLDQPLKSSGAVNWHHHAMPAVADLYYRDARAVARAYPRAYRRAISDNLDGFFRPTTDTRPFIVPEYTNSAAMRSWLDWTDRLVAGRPSGGKTAYLIFVLLPLTALWAAWRCVRGAWRWRTGDSAAGVAATALCGFCLANILYVSITTILMSYSDHCRYRFSLMPCFVVLAAMAGNEFAAWVRSRSAPIAERALPADRRRRRPA